MKTKELDFSSDPFTQAEQDRFWGKVQKTETCWLWTGTRMISGYGLLTTRGTQIVAHRMAYYLTYGDWPEGKVLCHTCDVRNCVNPTHLIPGSQADNMRDMAKKERWNTGNRHIARGEEIGTSKLTIEQVQQIREEYTTGGITQRALGRKYGVSQRQILDIIKERRWHYNTTNPDRYAQKVERECSYCGKTFIRTVVAGGYEPEPFCGHACRKEWNKRDIIERFWSHVDRSNPDVCWNWQGWLHRNGYGGMHGFRDRLVHRIAWELTNGDIPTGMHILHSCDNRSCVNPAHLSLGTRSDNMQDAARKGRLSAPRPHFLGELHPNSVLTDQQRQQIRERHAQGESYGALVKAFGVSKATIARVARGHR